MRAVVIEGKGGPEVFQVRERPSPAPQGEEVLVRVEAAGLNRADLLQAKGFYPPPPGVPTDIPGLEFAGHVEALGPLCRGKWKPGDRVYGLVGGGGLATHLVAHERTLAPIPSHLDTVAAAAIPEAFITAHDALEARAQLRPGESVLVHTVGGGVGTAALQLARAAGCSVIGTARSAWKLEKARELGLDHAVDTSTEDFAAVAQEWTAGRGVDVVLDFIGAAAWESNIRALAECGRLVLIGLLGGRKPSNCDLGALLAKRLTIVATTLRARPLEEKIATTQAFAARVNPWLDRGLVRPVVDQVFPLDQVREAMARLESNSGFGKIVLQMPD